MPSPGTEKGFSLLEAMIALFVIFVLARVALPNLTSMQKFGRINGDASSVAGLISEAKLRASASFSHARVYADLTAKTYHLEIWNKTSSCWQTDGDKNTCTVAASPVQNLSSGVSFGYGAISSAPSNTQPTLSQAPLCYTGYAGQAGNTTTVANTACIEFNSRGVPSNPVTSGKADATGAFYITNGTAIYGVTVLTSGSVQSWTAQTAQSSWQQR
ncbi:MAG TPA: hypothetical protein VGK48_01130 [Terriglobia bacterium]